MSHHWESKGTYVINVLGRFFPQQIANIININIRIWVGCIQSRNNLARTSWGSKDPVSTYMIVAGRVASDMPPWNHYIPSMDLIWLHVTIALLNKIQLQYDFQVFPLLQPTQQSKYTKVIPTMQCTCCVYAGAQQCGCQSEEASTNVTMVLGQNIAERNYCNPIENCINDMYNKSTSLEETQQTLGISGFCFLDYSTQETNGPRDQWFWDTLARKVEDDIFNDIHIFRCILVQYIIILSYIINVCMAHLPAPQKKHTNFTRFYWRPRHSRRSCAFSDRNSNKTRCCSSGGHGKI